MARNPVGYIACVELAKVKNYPSKYASVAYLQPGIVYHASGPIWDHIPILM